MYLITYLDNNVNKLIGTKGKDTKYVSTTNKVKNKCKMQQKSIITNLESSGLVGFEKSFGDTL